jgi:hypothetical protein
MLIFNLNPNSFLYFFYEQQQQQQHRLERIIT